MTFTDALRKHWREGKYIAISLDPDLSKIPASVAQGMDSTEDILFNFNKAIIDETGDLVAAFKPNSAFYEAEGEAGYRALKRTIAYVTEAFPDVLLILDSKRGDIANTNERYAKAAFEDLDVDAVTVHPYLGREAAEPFLNARDRGVFVLARTTNEGAKEFQDLVVDGEPLYMRVAKNVSREWNKNGNCGLVVGATYLDEMRNIRKIAPSLPFLIPGVGAQGGSAKEAFDAGKTEDGGVIIAVGRSVIYTSDGEDFAEAARKAVETHAGEIIK